MHASKRPVALRRHQPDPEAGRGAGDAQVPKNNGVGAPAIIPARPRTVRAEVELAPFPTIESLERPIEKVFCSAGGKSEAESCNLQLEREIILNRRSTPSTRRQLDVVSHRYWIPGYHSAMLTFVCYLMLPARDPRRN